MCLSFGLCEGYYNLNLTNRVTGERITMKMDLTIHNAVIDGKGEEVTVGIQGGRIAAISQELLPPGRDKIDAGGGLLSPALIDPHFHLENAFLDRPVNRSGTLKEAIDLYGGIKPHLTTEDIVARASRAIRMALANGTLWLRSHVDIDHIARLQLLEGVLAAREKYQDVFTVQIVAFPQWGLAANPEAVDLMWQAMERGADVVGGMPHGEKDMASAARQIEIAFEIALASDADIDMHCDETDDPYWHALELLAEKTIEAGYQGRVAASHCCAMAAWDDKMASRIIEKVARAGITVITNTPVNLHIQGRDDTRLVRRGIARVKELLDAGVNVSCGQDDMDNMFYPFGRMDMLEVANFAAHTAHLSSPKEILAAFNMPRYAAARALRIPDYGLEVGDRANLVIFNAKSVEEALRLQPERRYVIRDGKILVENRRETIFSDRIPA